MIKLSHLFPNLLVRIVIFVAIGSTLTHQEDLNTISSSNTNERTKPLAATGIEVAGYLPEYRFYIDVNKTVPFLTDLMLFSVSPSPHMVTGDNNKKNMLSFCCLNEDQFELGRQARASRSSAAKSSSSSSLKLWLTVGGGGRSDHFLKDSDGLTHAILDIASKQDLDGVDLDCEYFRSQDDYLAYLSWIRSAKPILHKNGLLVSVALHAGQFLHRDMYNQIDRINLMTYDMMSGSSSYHADLKSTQSAVDKLIQSGCPPTKIRLGIPAYARHKQNPGNVKSYAELIDEKENTDGRRIDMVELDNFDSWNGYQAESPKSVREKVEYAHSKHLAGVFFWELGQDKQHSYAPGGILLESASGRVFKDEQSDEL